MARNEEKAQSMLNRYLAMKQEARGTNRKPERRPKNPAECDDLQKAEKWRWSVIKEVSDKMSRIQNSKSVSVRARVDLITSELE